MSDRNDADKYTDEHTDEHTDETLSDLMIRANRMGEHVGNDHRLGNDHGQ